jgi:hypothetical protein
MHFISAQNTQSHPIHNDRQENEHKRTTIGQKITPEL